MSQHPKAKNGFELNTPLLRAAYRDNPQFRQYIDGIDPNKSEGLGDTIWKILDKFGIHRVMRKVQRRGCGGCRRRRDKLNKLIPYKQ